MGTLRRFILVSRIQGPGKSASHLGLTLRLTLRLTLGLTLGLMLGITLVLSLTTGGCSSAPDEDGDQSTPPVTPTTDEGTPTPVEQTPGSSTPGSSTPTPEEETPTPLPPLDAALFEPVPWDNTTVYFVMTDRFLDGNPDNNQSYGRSLDGDKEIGTFHGGDLAGLTQRLNQDYFNRLGVSAIWITAPYEQIHGWVVGGSDEFRHYAYHGYYALDFTNLDANFGTEAELRTFVDTAHSKGIRVILDVVMNHPGYASIQDLHELEVDVLLEGWDTATPSKYHDYIDYDSDNWVDWWGLPWIRAGLGGGYDTGGTDDLTKSLSYLPDFKTESTDVDIGLPSFFAVKTDHRAQEDPTATVRNYLVRWLARWVEEYGIDGFRCDTAKHVEKEAWLELREAADSAFASWRAANPDKAFSDALYSDLESPFWMTGEVYPHGVEKDAYYDYGFDSLINFDFAGHAAGALDNYLAMEPTYASNAADINSDPDFNALSYLSSHDTSLFFEASANEDLEAQKRAGTLLLLAPGGVQIFYGDENARPNGPSSTDSNQATRSDYQWGDNPEVLTHWRKVGQFRRLHPAIGAGSHLQVSESPYGFRRAYQDDVVYCVLGASGSVTLDVSSDFATGQTVRDYYSDTTAEVVDGQVTFEVGASGLLLIERVD